MIDIQDITTKIESYAERVGVEPATVCRNATGNPRLWQRMKDRAQRLEDDIRRVSEFIDQAENKTDAA